MFRAPIPSHPSPSLLPTSVRSVVAIAAISLPLAFPPLGLVGCSSGGDDGTPTPSPGVVELTARSQILAVTGAAGFEAKQLLSTSDGRALVFDGISESVVLIQKTGVPTLFTAGASLRSVTGKASVELGPMIQVTTPNSQLRSQVLSADDESGDLIILATDGVPAIFSSPTAIKGVTAQLTYKMSLPRELTINQIIAQDLVTKSLLLFAPTGVAQSFLAGAALATAAQVPFIDADVTGWTRGPLTTAQFARFASTNSIVKVGPAVGQVSLYVSAAALTAVFPTIANLKVLDCVAVLQNSQELLVILLGSGTRGVALAIVATNASGIFVFTSQAQFETVAGATVDISDIALIPEGLIAVDRGGAQVLKFLQDGTPVIMGSRAEMEAASGVDTPEIEMATGLGSQGAIVPEDETDSLLLVVP